MTSSDTAQGSTGSEIAKIALNLDEAVERMGDKEIYLEIARYFAEHLPQYLKDLTTSLTAGDTETCTRLAHSLKGNCAKVGAEGLRQDCYILETLCREGTLDKARDHYSDLVPQLLSLRETLLEL